MTETTCRCGKPTRDAAYTCDDCSQELFVALGEIPWLEEQLEITITKAKGIDYRTLGGTKSDDVPMLYHPTASEARINLRAVLVAWVKFCDEEGIRNQSPHTGLPVDSLTHISRWLIWRIDGLALNEIGAEAVDEITSAVAHCHRLVDRPAEKQFLGLCDVCKAVGDDGRLYGKHGSASAKCNVCGNTVDAERLRAKLLTDLDDRLCTAAEIAHLSTYLGLRAGREQVRKRINQWHKRKRISGEPAFGVEPVFRFGIVWRLLAQEDASKESA